MTLGDNETACLRNVGHRVFKGMASQHKHTSATEIPCRPHGCENCLVDLYRAVRRCAAALRTILSLNSSADGSKRMNFADV
jgi:hypothetical protein